MMNGIENVSIASGTGGCTLPRRTGVPGPAGAENQATPAAQRSASVKITGRPRTRRVMTRSRCTRHGREVEAVAVAVTTAPRAKGRRAA